tara:strand:- start:140 stop:667 length:528 start_codon:yes stop_codon:yes gene_type:complete
MSQINVNSIASAAGTVNKGILQVLQTVKTDTASISSSSTNTFVDLTGMTVAITPRSTSSKILVMFTANVANSTGTSHIRLVRDSTAIMIGASASSRLQSTAMYRDAASPYSLSLPNWSSTFLDSPSSTSALTYKLQVTLGSSYSGTIYLNRCNDDTDADYGGRTASSITVMEIQG